MVEIPSFAIERSLGEGAFGAVFLARETAGMQRKVALKVFRTDSDEAYQRELDMTRRIEGIRCEARVGELVQALDSGMHAGRGWIALEYLESGSLQDVVEREGALGAGRAVRYAVDAARALVELHTANVFHRDVKPANLLLGSDDRVRLGDFGLSRDLSGSLSAAGSPAFAAPEVIAGSLADGCRADVYSLGATLVYLLTAETMYPGHPDVFRFERCGVPPALQQILVRATRAEPQRRIASSGELLELLEDLDVEEEAVFTPPANRVGWTQLGAVTSAPQRDVSTSRVALGGADVTPDASGPSRTLLAPWLVVGVLALAAAAGVWLPPVAGPHQIAGVADRFPFVIAAPVGARVSVRDATGAIVSELVQVSTPVQLSLPGGWYSVETSAPLFHPGRERVELGPGTAPFEPTLRSVVRHSTQHPEVEGFWALPVFFDVDSDGVLDVITVARDRRDGVLVALSGATGRLLWRCLAHANQWARPALVPAPLGTQIALGVLRGTDEAWFAYLDPHNGQIVHATHVGPARKPPAACWPTELAGAGGFASISDAVGGSTPSPAYLTGMTAEGEVAWQIDAERLSVDGERDTYGVRMTSVDSNADGVLDAVVWETGGELVAVDPKDPESFLWRVQRGGPHTERWGVWTDDHDDWIAMVWNGDGPANLVLVDHRGNVGFRTDFPGRRINRMAWLELEPNAPRRLLVSIMGPPAELQIRQADGSLLASTTGPGNHWSYLRLVRSGASRFVLATLPTSLKLLNPRTLEEVWNYQLTGLTTVEVVDLEGDGNDELVLLDREGRMAVLDPVVPAAD